MTDRDDLDAADTAGTGAGRTTSRAAAARRARRIGGRPTGLDADLDAAGDPSASAPSVAARAASSSPAAAETAAEPTTGPAAAETRAETHAETQAGRSARPVLTKARATEPVDTEPVDTEPAPRRDNVLAWAPAILCSIVALVFAVLIAVDAGKGSSGATSKASSSLRDQVLAAAKSCVAQVNTYDYRTLAADERKALACTTGSYTKAFKTAFDSVIAKKGPGLHATQKAQIDLAGIESISENGKTWTILLFGQLTVTNNTDATNGRVDPIPIEATMQKVGGKWLIAKVAGA